MLRPQQHTIDLSVVQNKPSAVSGVCDDNQDLPIANCSSCDNIAAKDDEEKYFDQFLNIPCFTQNSPTASQQLNVSKMCGDTTEENTDQLNYEIL